MLGLGNVDGRDVNRLRCRGTCRFRQKVKCTATRGTKEKGGKGIKKEKRGTIRSTIRKIVRRSHNSIKREHSESRK